MPEDKKTTYSKKNSELPLPMKIIEGAAWLTFAASMVGALNGYIRESQEGKLNTTEKLELLAPPLFSSIATFAIVLNGIVYRTSRDKKESESVEDQDKISKFEQNTLELRLVTESLNRIQKRIESVYVDFLLAEAEPSGLKVGGSQKFNGSPEVRSFSLDIINLIVGNEPYSSFLPSSTSHHNHLVPMHPGSEYLSLEEAQAKGISNIRSNNLSAIILELRNLYGDYCLIYHRFLEIVIENNLILKGIKGKKPLFNIPTVPGFELGKLYKMSTIPKILAPGKAKRTRVGQVNYL